MIKIGEYTIRSLKDGRLWIQKDDGEGMEVMASTLSDWLTIYWEDHF